MLNNFLSTFLCTAGDVVIESSDEDDWEDLEEAKREEIGEM